MYQYVLSVFTPDRGECLAAFNQRESAACTRCIKKLDRCAVVPDITPVVTRHRTNATAVQQAALYDSRRIQKWKRKFYIKADVQLPISFTTQILSYINRALKLPQQHYMTTATLIFAATRSQGCIFRTAVWASLRPDIDFHFKKKPYYHSFILIRLQVIFTYKEPRGFLVLSESNARLQIRGIIVQKKDVLNSIPFTTQVWQRDMHKLQFPGNTAYPLMPSFSPNEV